jgi:hypothetical protein
VVVHKGKASAFSDFSKLLFRFFKTFVLSPNLFSLHIVQVFVSCLFWSFHFQLFLCEIKHVFRVCFRASFSIISVWKQMFHVILTVIAGQKCYRIFIHCAKRDAQVVFLLSNVRAIFWQIKKEDDVCIAFLCQKMNWIQNIIYSWLAYWSVCLYHKCKHTHSHTHKYATRIVTHIHTALNKPKNRRQWSDW